MNITPILNAVIALVAAVISAFLIPFIRSKVSAQRLATVAELVNFAVKAAEQIYAGSGRGEEKKAYVVNYLAEKGYVLDVSQVSTEINNLIESAVFGLGGEPPM
jgi:hypothetical protein